MPKQKKQYLNSTNIPLQFWWNIHDMNNYIWLVKDADHSEVDHSEESFLAYKDIDNGVINKYGVGKSYMKLLKKKKRYLILANEAELADDNYKRWRAKLLKAEIDKVENEESVGNREDSLINLGKFVYGRPVGPMEITLDQYYANMDYCERLMIAQKNSAKNNG